MSAATTCGSGGCPGSGATRSTLRTGALDQRGEIGRCREPVRERQPGGTSPAARPARGRRESISLADLIGDEDRTLAAAVAFGTRNCGDLHAGIDGAVYATDPLLECADRDGLD
jgi:hypothetical protein